MRTLILVLSFLVLFIPGAYWRELRELVRSLWRRWSNRPKFGFEWDGEVVEHFKPMKTGMLHTCPFPPAQRWRGEADGFVRWGELSHGLSPAELRQAAEFGRRMNTTTRPSRALAAA